jgi:Flp pilus assembly pilin Flp
MEDGGMESVTRAWVKVREWHKRLSKGQTMTEYALIMAAVAVVVFVTYETMGQDIGSLVNKVNTDLTTAS